MTGPSALLFLNNPLPMASQKSTRSLVILQKRLKNAQEFPVSLLFQIFDAFPFSQLRAAFDHTIHQLVVQIRCIEARPGEKYRIEMFEHLAHSTGSAGEVEVKARARKRLP
jgi:hypothetical protein